MWKCVCKRKNRKPILLLLSENQEANLNLNIKSSPKWYLLHTEIVFITMLVIRMWPNYIATSFVAYVLINYPKKIRSYKKSLVYFAKSPYSGGS